VRCRSASARLPHPSPSRAQRAPAGFSPVGVADGEGCRPHLPGDLLLPLLYRDERGHPLVVDVHGRDDEVVDVQVELAAHLLDPPDHLAGVALGLQRRREGDVDVDRRVLHGGGEDALGEGLREGDVARRDRVAVELGLSVPLDGGLQGGAVRAARSAP
jgi:hypothetical protein